MKKRKPDARKTPSLDQLIAEIIVDADSEQEQLWAFRQAIEDHVTLPSEAAVIGEPVSVLEIEYSGNERRGITLLCGRPDGRQHIVAACDVEFPAATEGARYIAALRQWMGLSVPPAGSALSHGTTSGSPARRLSGVLELAVLSLRAKSAFCRSLANREVIALRCSHRRTVVPGEIAVVRPTKQWRYGGRLQLIAEIESVRLDAEALGLAPLGLRPRGTWDPCDHYWGEEGEPIAAWAKPIISHGPRPQFEMEQVLPGEETYDEISDPITESNDYKEAGDRETASRILMSLCQADLRCLDAHAHLGNLLFDRRPAEAIRHYAAGVRIGELSLPKNFDGLLPWGLIDNRPFLRSLHGYALCLWRLGRFKEATQVFSRMLWLNPNDNQGVRFLFDEVRAGVTWAASRER